LAAFAKGDIVLFPFPYTNLTDKKIRPCLVISNEMNQDIILCQITSQQIKRDEFSIELKQNETKQGSLKINSYIRVNMIFIADKSIIIKKICQVPDKIYTLVTSTINNMIK